MTSEIKDKFHVNDAESIFLLNPKSEPKIHIFTEKTLIFHKQVKINGSYLLISVSTLLIMLRR